MGISSLCTSVLSVYGIFLDVLSQLGGSIICHTGKTMEIVSSESNPVRVRIEVANLVADGLLCLCKS